MKKLGIFAMIVLLGACASKTARKDPLAEAASVKRVEIERLADQIAKLKANPDAAALAGKIDSLERRKALEEANVAGIGKAAQTMLESKDTGKIFDAANEEKWAQEKNRKHPIK